MEVPKAGRNEVATLEKKVDASSRQVAVALTIIMLLTASLHAAVDISSTDAQRIGKRIWQNECGGTISGLTSWNVGENFASLGIGHFIWYPKGQRGPFDESFPKLVRFVSAHGAKLPPFLLAGHDTFLPLEFACRISAAVDSPKMKQLRQFSSKPSISRPSFSSRACKMLCPK
jgi:hypothetical protein